DQPSGDFTNGVNHDQVGKPAAPIDPLLGPLQNNGGPTHTLALLPRRPALHHGTHMFRGVDGRTPVLDQRWPGVLRTAPGADLRPAPAWDSTDGGAFELPGQLPPPPPVCPTFATKANFLATEATDPRGSLVAQTLFVNGLYHVLLNRAPDQAGLNDWVFLL